MRSSWLSHESRSISGSVSKNGADTKGAKRKSKLHTYLLTYILAIQVVEFSNGGFKIGKVSTKESTYSKEIIEFWQLD